MGQHNTTQSQSMVTMQIGLCETYRHILYTTAWKVLLNRHAAFHLLKQRYSVEWNEVKRK